MIDLNFTDDGCSLPQSELLALMRLGLSDGETVSEIEFPDDGRNELSGRGEASSTADVRQDESLSPAMGIVEVNAGCSAVDLDCGSSAPPAQFIPSISDRGLILVALTQEDADETAKILESRSEDLMARNPLLKP